MTDLKPIQEVRLKIITASQLMNVILSKMIDEMNVPKEEQSLLELLYEKSLLIEKTCCDLSQYLDFGYIIED